MNRQNIVKSISTSFPTDWHNATKFGVNQILMAITLASISGIKRINKIAALVAMVCLVKTLLKLDKAINENAISAALKGLGQKGARKLQIAITLFVCYFNTNFQINNFMFCINGLNLFNMNINSLTLQNYILRYVYR